MRFIIAAAFSLMVTLSQAAGLRFIDIPADSTAPAMKGAVWYPCALSPQPVKIGETSRIFGAHDCPIVGRDLPLIVVSHGRTGWFGGHHDTAAALADAGFIVAAIDHPGDNSTDQSRVDDLSVLIGRPADMKRLIDFMLTGWSGASALDPERVGFFGFSMGGYTGLVVVGANPDFSKDLPGCQRSDFRACEQIRVGNNNLLGAPVHDPRVSAAVIVDPGPSIFFPAENLKSVNVPIQLWSSDPKLSAGYFSGCCAIGINQRLPSKPDYHLASNAIHFSFLAPCTPEEKQALPRICTDAPGFDRAAFHREFNAEVLSFFRKHLVDMKKP